MAFKLRDITLTGVRVLGPVGAANTILADKLFLGWQHQRREATALERFNIQAGKLRSQWAGRIDSDKHVIGVRRITETFLLQINIAEGAISVCFIGAMAARCKPVAYRDDTI